MRASKGRRLRPLHLSNGALIFQKWRSSGREEDALIQMIYVPFQATPAWRAKEGGEEDTNLLLSTRRR